MKRRYIAEEWFKFAAVIFKDRTDISEEQRRDMRMSFICGASILFSFLVHGVSEGLEVKPCDLVMMDSLQEEVNAIERELRGRLK